MKWHTQFLNLCYKIKDTLLSQNTHLNLILDMLLIIQVWMTISSLLHKKLFQNKNGIKYDKEKIKYFDIQAL
jgi:hypothetical protein